MHSITFPVILILLTEIIFCSYLHVGIDNPIYDYLDRLATKGVLLSYQNNTLPLNRQYISQMLTQLNNKRDELSRIDQELLDEYLANYRYELTDMQYFNLGDRKMYHPFTSWQNITSEFRDVFTFSEKQENHHLIVYENDGNLIWMDIGGMARYEVNNSNGRFPFAYHYNLAVLLGEQFVVYSDADIYSMVYNTGFGELEYPQEYKGGFEGYHEGFYGFDHEMSFEYANAYVQYTSNFGNISLATEPLLWGNAKYPIILSDNVPPFSMVSWDKRLGNSHFSFFHGTILPAESKEQDSEGFSSFAEKYLVGHRWEISISDKLNGAFTEMLVYGGRDPELVYFIPTIFLWPIQHNMTSQSGDNILWFIESEYFPMSNIKLYSTFMIDELRIKEIFNDWHGNRWALQGGTHITGELFSYPTDLRIEFTAVRPWAYTHRIPLYGSYTHNGRCLGFYNGPNSQFLYTENRWWLSTRSLIIISYERLHWGEDPEKDINDEYHFGNNSNEDYKLLNPNYLDQTGWIIGDIISTHTIDFLWGYQLSNIIGMKLGISHQWNIDDYKTNYSIQVNIDY